MEKRLVVPVMGGGSNEADDSSVETVQRILEATRSVTGAQLAWISRRVGAGHVVEHVAAPDGVTISVGWEWPPDVSDLGSFDSSDSGFIVQARTGSPQFNTLEERAGFPIGSFIGAVLTNGADQVGMLCCVCSETRGGLGGAEQRILESLAAAATEVLVDDPEQARHVTSVRARIGEALRGSQLHTVFQPIVALDTGRAVGAEALSRFRSEPQRPDLWFADAESVGLGIALELVAARSALHQIFQLPPDVYLSVNASPNLIMTQDFRRLIDAVPADRVVVEITEHVAVNDYSELLEATGWLRRQGCRIAVDDVGAGFASFAHVLKLQPDMLKIDISIIRGIDTDPARKGLARGIVSMARDTGATVVAEGVETERELNTALAVGVDAVQGYYLGRPNPLPMPDSFPRPTARILDETGTPVSDQDLLGYITRSWLRASNLETVARSFLDIVQARTGLQTSYLTIMDPETKALEGRFVNNTGAIELSEGVVMAWDDTLCKRARTAGIRWTSAVPADLPGCDAAEALDVKTFLSIPVTLPDGAVAGTLCAASTESRFVSSTTLDEIELMARLIGDRLDDRP